MDYTKITDHKSKYFILVILLSAIVTFVIGILIGRFATCPDTDTDTKLEVCVNTGTRCIVLTGVSSKIVQDGDPAISDILIREIKAENIESNLR